MRILLSQKAKEYLKSNGYKKIFMTRGKDRCISIFSKQEWDHQKEKLGSLYPQKRQREKMIKLFMPSVEADLENNGYGVIEIPDELKIWAGIKDEFTIIARANRVEIWSKSNDNPHSKGFSIFTNSPLKKELGGFEPLQAGA